MQENCRVVWTGDQMAHLDKLVNRRNVEVFMAKEENQQGNHINVGENLGEHWGVPTG